jgi:hypothetical protein
VSLSANVPQSVDSLIEQLKSSPTAWVRLGAARYEESWEVEVCDIVTGAPPVSWRAERLIYRDAILLAIRTKGSTAARWLHKGRARLNNTNLIFPQLNPNPQVQREAGGSHTGYEPSRWPTIRTDLVGTPITQHQQPQQMLVHAGNPTFHTFATGARYILRDPSAIDSTIFRRLSYRHLDTHARIATVEYTDQDMWISLEGDHLAGITVELMGSTPGPSRRLRRAPLRPVHLRLSEVVPQNAFVVLVRDDLVLDRKTVGWDYPTMQDPDVRRLVKFDPNARLEALLYQKENQQVEFKQGIIGDADSEKETVLKTVAAFANGAGGSLYFGINKRYEATGIRDTDAPDFQDSVSDLIDDWVHPTPTWTFDLVDIPGSRSRVVVALNVSPGDVPPYGIGTTSRSLRYYVRHAARSLPARPDEVRALARSRPPSEPPSGLF